MPDLSTLTLFAAAAAALLVIPGPSVLFVVGRTLEHGRRGGLVSMLGVETGALVHVAAATAGISALVATSDVALLGIKLGGAAYLGAHVTIGHSPDRRDEVTLRRVAPLVM
jgi:threonine/homoserine/homoserine lactone efflux protein